MTFVGSGRASLVAAGSLLIGAIATTALPAPGPASAAPAPDSTFSGAQSDYVEYCAGCHGLQGRSAPTLVPELRGRVGWFLCTPEGRAYLIRLPNVSHAPIADNEELATLMNFVVFGIGGGSAPAGAAPFDGAEVARLRAQALRPGTELKAMRRRLVESIVRACGAPGALLSAPTGRSGAGQHG